MAHIGRLAETDVPRPAFVSGMGALLEAPSSVLKWQVSERDAYSLSKMDSDGDGITSNDEVRKNFPRTPSSIFGMIGPFLHPKGSWDKDAIGAVATAQLGVYDKMRADALALDDDAPYPDATTPMARASWWKSWFLDERPVAERLASWKVPVTLHYGETDSQTPPFRQTNSAKSHLSKLDVKLHAGLGHSLGQHPLLGPIDKSALDALVESIVQGVRNHCN
jgi:pimeloyl-ACP methyl ester carboxylesterase